jgi:5'-nucleotidase
MVKKMKIYEWILFDADDTLFHFDAFSGLQLMFSHFDITFTKQDYHEYQVINKSLWVDYQNGEITAQQLQHQRFNSWAEKLQVLPHELNSAFLSAMAEICMPLEGAISLLCALQGKAKLGIITNGFTELQQTRLERTGLSDHFELLVISEQVGVAKPHVDIFEHALSAMGNPAREKVLMVGDNPESDILGGINAGLDTCWINANNNPVPDGITPLYQVSSLSELKNLLLGAYGG